MREFMKLLEARMDYAPSAKLQALATKLEALQDAASAEGEKEIQALLKAMKRLYPKTTFRWSSGMGSRSIRFEPPIEIEGSDYEIDVLIGQVDRQEWAVVRGDDRAQAVLGFCEQVFQIADHLDEMFRVEVSELKS